MDRFDSFGAKTGRSSEPKKEGQSILSLTALVVLPSFNLAPMDVVESVRRCLLKWDNGGDAEWYVFSTCSQRHLTLCSLSILATPHSNPTDPTSNDLLSTIYHTLITSTLLTWQPEASLSSSAFVQFVQSVLGSLPSSSSDKSPSVAAFGELLVDLFWTIDVELDDVHSDAKIALANAEQGNVPTAVDGADAAAVIARVAQVKQSAEADKDTVATIVKALVVRQASYQFQP